MARRSFAYIVCSPRARVGKTLLARLVADFQIFNGRRPLAYDLNRHENALAALLPQITRVADISDTRGQMALFDNLIAEGEHPRILDLGSEAFDAFFTVARQIGFMEEAARRGVEPLVLVLADPHPRSAQIYGHLRRSFAESLIVPVENEANFSAEPYMAHFPAGSGGSLFLPRLNPVIRGVIDKPHFSFAGFMSRPAETRTELHGWTERVFVAFRELELRAMLRELSASLRS